MAVLNVNDEPTQGVVLLDPDTGQPIIPGRTSLTLEAALMLFPMKEQVAAALKPVPPSFAFMAPAGHGEATYVNYSQSIPLQVKQAGGENIKVSNNTIALKAGGVYKLTASISALYSYQGAAFAWTAVDGLQPIGVVGGTNGSPWNWTNKGDAVAVIAPSEDTVVRLTYLCPWSSLPLWGGNEWDYNMPAGSWITAEELK